MSTRPLVSTPYCSLTLGALPAGDGSTRFLVWAPAAQRLELCLPGPPECFRPLHARDRGYFETTIAGLAPGTPYWYRIDGALLRPDPASRFQPGGVHAPSAIVDPAFPWTDEAWHGIPLHQYIVYELHVGTFSAEGTFEGIIRHLESLRDLGITAVELMPVAQFPGSRNWGYDGVLPFSVQNTYGGPAGLKRLINACHQLGLAVVLDVVFNHFGPEGNYLAEFGPYFTSRYPTPWGTAINFDGPHSDEVRRYFLECALHWVHDYHVDALRLDAVHAIFDLSARPFLAELAAMIRWEGEQLDRRVFTIAESSQNDSRLLRATDVGGCGIDALWCDDFHHALRTGLGQERSGYYQDYQGFDDVVKAYRDGFVLDGRYSEFYQRRHGNPAQDLAPGRFFVFCQNHDQVGNRMLGERLAELVPFEALKLAASLVILSPYLPLLFMGEEYGETARFTYFISHGDPDLAASVLRGRREEFAPFCADGEPPDPQNTQTFLLSRLDHRLQERGRHRTLRSYYRRLIALRKGESMLARSSRDRMAVRVLEPGKTFSMQRWQGSQELLTVFHFGAEPSVAAIAAKSGWWEVLLDSAQACWGGPGTSGSSHLHSNGMMSLPLAPCSAVLLRSRA